MDPGFYVDDPHSAYASLRRFAPVWWCEAGGFWAISKHADITAIATQPSVFSSAHGSFIQDVTHREKITTRAVRGSKLSFGADPPEHTTYRRLVSGAFSPRNVREMEAEVRRIAVASIDAIDAEEVTDFASAVAIPTSLNVIAGLLGVPPADWADFKRWSDAVSEYPDAETGSPEEARLREELDALERYLLEQLDDRRGDPREDLMTAISAIEIDGEPTSPQFQLSFARALLVAGNETTRNTLSGGVIALAENPDQLRRLSDEPALAIPATEEILRWTSVIHAFIRRASTDTTIRDTPIAAGDYVALLFPAANRDDEAWPQADVFDIGRTGPSPHLAYSWGQHRCLGAHLANLEIKVVLEELVRRFGHWEIAGDVVCRPSTVVDTYEQVPIAFSERSRQG